MSDRLKFKPKKKKVAKYQRVAVVRDDDGHIYVIPHNLENEFRSLCNQDDPESERIFIEKFGEFMTGGHISVPLYIKISDSDGPETPY